MIVEGLSGIGLATLIDEHVDKRTRKGVKASLRSAVSMSSDGVWAVDVCTVGSHTVKTFT